MVKKMEHKNIEDLITSISFICGNGLKDLGFKENISLSYKNFKVFENKEYKVFAQYESIPKLFNITYCLKK